MSALARYRGPRVRATKSPYQYPYQQYPYQNVGTQLTWRDSPPAQTRAPQLGGYLPAPGAPEQIPIESGYSGYIEDKGLAGCGCGGSCANQYSLGAIPVVDDVANMLRPYIGEAATPVVIAGGLAAAFLIFKRLTK